MSPDIAPCTGRVIKEMPAGRAGIARATGDALVFLAADGGRCGRGIDLVVDGDTTRVYAGRACASPPDNEG